MALKVFNSNCSGIINIYKILAIVVAILLARTLVIYLKLQFINLIGLKFVINEKQFI